MEVDVSMFPDKGMGERRVREKEIRTKQRTKTQWHCHVSQPNHRPGMTMGRGRNTAASLHGDKSPGGLLCRCSFRQRGRAGRGCGTLPHALAVILFLFVLARLL